MTYTFHSLFAGAYDGFAIAMKAVGFEQRCAVEVDEWRREQIKKHHPDVRVKGDIREVGKRNLEPVDVLVGGFPCSDISNAGKRAGIADGNRSGLWFEFARVIGELRPRAIILENVASITVAGRGLDLVLGELSAMGYDAVWLTVRASDVGAPHQRERWFCVGYAREIGQPEPQATVIRAHERNRKRHNPTAARGRQHIVRPSLAAGQVGNAHTAGRAKQRRSFAVRQKQSAPQHTDQAVPHTTKKRFYAGQPSQRWAYSAQVRAGMDNRLERLRQAGRYPRVKPAVGRDTDGIPSGVRELLSHRFPAPPGEQYQWEPPRVEYTTVLQDRRQCLEALGDALVPQQVVGVCWGVWRFLKAMDERMMEVML